MDPRPLAFAASVAAVGGVVGACGGGASHHPESVAAFEKLRAEQPESTGATVGGREVSLASFRFYWSDHPDRSREEVLDRVVDREIAVQRAVERGWHRSAPLGRYRKQAMVRRLLRREIERAIRPSDLDPSAVDKEVEKLRARLGHPAGIRASHLVVTPTDEEGARSGSGAIGTPEERRAAKTWVERIRGRLPTRADLPDLFEVRREFRSRLPESLEIVVDAHLQFPAPGARSFKGELPPGWSRVVQKFGEVADEMLRQGRAGALSDPVETRFGWHVIRAEARIPAEVPDAEATREVAVSRKLRERRKERYRQLWKKWKAGASITLRPEAFAEGRR